MLRKIIVPNGWQCTLEEAPPGPFVTLANPDLLCFKTEYYKDDQTSVMAFNSAGEYFVTGNDTMVQPVEMIEEEV